jgi:hypothetical protein
MANFLTFALLTVAVAGLAGAVPAGGDKQPPFKITTKRDTDRVMVEIDKDTTVFRVRSPFGISQATIERTGEKWPDAVKLRLHLKGLESFRASNGKTTLDAAVSSQDGKARLWKDGKENAPLDDKSPFWMNIRPVGSDGEPAKTMPLKDGYFEMTLPRAFFAENPKSIALTWIDFYRN